MSESRTQKSIKNSVVAFAFYIVNLILQFFSRKIFLEYLGTEILGLNTTAQNLLQFLNLAELGISSAVAFTLYKPIFEKDYSSINEIVALQGALYKRVASIIIIGAFVLMCFFPLIFAKMQLPLWYAFASFGVLLFSALLGYFVNYRQILLSANQEDYKILYSYRSVILCKIMCQMLAMSNLSNGYVWWLVLEVVFAIIASSSLTVMTRRTFPYLSKCDKTFNELKSKYSEFTLKIKQVFFHKIGLFALAQSSPIIIYAYSSLTMVALYGNYLIITTGLQALFIALFNGVASSIGNLVAEGDKIRSLKVFNDLFSLRFAMLIPTLFSAYFLTHDFIRLWIGEQYLLSDQTLLLMLAILYVNVSRMTVDGFINASGLFKDIWAPIFEAVLNIGMSIILGAVWGLNGVLGGVLISLIVVVLGWKPYFLFYNEFKGYYKWYIKMYFKHILAAILTYCCMVFILGCLPEWINSDTTSIFIMRVAVVGIISLIVCILCMVVCQCGLNSVVKRFIK